MHGYQIRTLIEKMYLIQRLIVEQNWDELKKTCKIACEVEEILYEINQYPGKITCCENINDFFATLVLGDFDGFNIYATIDFWYDNEQSDLSMECYAEFYGRLLKSITLNKVHVF